MADPESPSPLADGAADIAQASDLCMSCGMCCNGLLHNAAVLDADEVAAAAAIGLAVLDRPGRPGFALPCTKLEGTVCTIYGHRPRVCSGFRCQVLIDLENGRHSFDQAAQRVATARQLLAEVVADMPATASAQEVKTMVRTAISGSGRHADRLRVTALTFYLDKHFRKAKESKMLEMTEVETGGEG